MLDYLGGPQMQSDTTTYEEDRGFTLRTGKCNGQIEQRFEDDGLKDWRAVGRNQES